MHLHQLRSYRRLRSNLIQLTLYGFLLASLNLHAQQAPVEIEHGTYAVHLLLHTIGSEEYTVTDSGSHQQLNITTNTSDRGTKRNITSTLDMLPSLSPTKFEQHTTAPTIAPSTATSPALDYLSLTEILGNKVTVHEGQDIRTFLRPPVAFTGSADMPAAAQMMMMRYWLHHHRPPQLNLLRASAKALPVVIRPVGHDVFTVHGQIVRLTRYTIANLAFGREVLWMNDNERVAAIMSIAVGLPQEEILDEYKSAFDPLIQSGIRQQMLDLADLTRTVRPNAASNFAITGARLIDATGSPPINNSIVIIRNNKIAAVGPAASIRIPPKMRIIHATGKSLLPGLWDMNTHYSAVEFGPELLASGITTARNCGGEFGFLTAVRHAIDIQHQLGPRLLLAGLIDGSSPNTFGVFTADTPSEGTVFVDLYADAHFDQIEAYTHLKPSALQAINEEAHKRGLTVTRDETSGTDLSSELELKVKAGMTPLEAIQSSTIVSARAMHHDADSGTIEIGKRADLVLIDGDPLADISALRNVVSVVTDGHLYDSKRLAASVAFHH